MDGESVKAFFSVLNDAIKKEDLGRSGYKRVGTRVPHEKRYSSMPAAKIGRLGVATDAQRDGWGTFVLDFLKVWFTEKNKTGCRFLVVDAYNTKEVTAFYEKNGFKFLTAPVPGEQTRIMYFDLMPFDSAATDES